MLDTALNKGNKPPVIADRIEVVELEMGTQPPELEIRDIGELTVDQFRGIFRLTYSGDAHLLLKTKVQANPLNHKQPDIHLMSGSRGMLAAKDPLVVPMLLRLSNFKLNSYVVLVVSKQKGITLVFKTDPLQNVDINSTFDSIAVIQKFIQREIEGQLRQMFREDLPGIIHRLSQQWVKAKVEAPYLEKSPRPLPVRHTHTSQSTSDLPAMGRPPLSAVPTSVLRQNYLVSLGYTNPRAQSYGGRPQSYSGGSVVRSNRTKLTTPGAPRSTRSSASMPSPPGPPAYSSHTDLEDFDPTYGLRPEGLPTRSIFQSFSKLFAPSKGLADLTEEQYEDVEDDYDDEEEVASFDILDWDAPSARTPAPSVQEEPPRMEFESVPAVGGGTITRPRIYHAQSDIQSPGPSRPTSSRPESNPYFPDDPSRTISERRNFFVASPTSLTPGAVTPNPYGLSSMNSSISSLHHPPTRPITPDSQDTYHALPTPPSLLPHQEPAVYTKSHNSPLDLHRQRRLSVSSSNLDGRPGSPSAPALPTDSKIVLRPSLNHSIHQLSTLSHSNHTLSPFTRSLEHFTVRSIPPRLATAPGTYATPDRVYPKAKRKRTHQLGAKNKSSIPIPAVPPEELIPTSAPSSPACNSEFDASDMDRYFRSIDELYPSPNALQIRRRGKRTS